MRAAPKITPPILFCWPTMSDMDVSGLAIEAEPSCQYPIKYPVAVRQTEGLSD